MRAKYLSFSTSSPAVVKETRFRDSPVVFVDHGPCVDRERNRGDKVNTSGQNQLDSAVQFEPPELDGSSRANLFEDESDNTEDDEEVGDETNLGFIDVEIDDISVWCAYEC